MEHAFSILMFIFGGMLLVYSAVLFATGDIKLVFRHWAAEIKDDKEYARRFAGVMALVALAPVIGGITAFFAPPLVTGIVMAASFIVFLCLGVRIMKKGGQI